MAGVGKFSGVRVRDGGELLLICLYTSRKIYNFFVEVRQRTLTANRGKGCGNSSL